MALEPLEITINANTSGVDKAEREVREKLKKIQDDSKVKLEVNIAQAEKKVEELQKELRRLRKTGGDTIEVRIKTNRAKRQLSDLRREYRNLLATGSTTVSRFQQSINGISSAFSKGLGILGVATGFTQLSRAIGGASRLAKDFELQIARVGQISGATADQILQIEKVTRDLGRTTQFTAKQAAEGFEFLALAGLSVEESIAALPSTLDLALAGNLDLARSADIASNVLSQFQLSAEDTTRVVDVLAATQANSNTNIEQLSEALKFAGTTLGGLGTPIEEVSAAIGLLGNAGLQGGISTRALSTSIIGLADESKKGRKALDELGVSAFDQQGNFQGLVSLFTQVEDATADMTQEQRLNTLTQIFGAEALKSVNAILNQGADELANFTEQLRNSTGTAQEFADAIGKTTEGRLRAVQSRLQEIGIAAGGVINSILIPIFEGLATVGELLAQNAAAARIALVGLAGAAAGIAFLFPGGALVVGVVAAAAGITALVGGIGKLIDSSRNAGAAVSQLNSELKELKSSAREQKKELKEIDKTLRLLSRQYDRGLISAQDYREEVERLAKRQQELTPEFEKVEQRLNQTRGASKKLKAEIGFLQRRQAFLRIEMDRGNDTTGALSAEYDTNRQKLALLRGTIDGYVDAQGNVVEINTDSLDAFKVLQEATNQFSTASTVDQFNKQRDAALQAARASLSAIKVLQENLKTQIDLADDFDTKIPLQENLGRVLASRLALENEIRAAESLQFQGSSVTNTTTSNDGSGGGGRVSSEKQVQKQIIQEQEKGIKKRALAEISAIKESNKLQEQKVLAIRKVEQQLQEDLEKIRGQTLDQVLQENEERFANIKEGAEESLDDVQDAFSQSIEDIDEYIEELAGIETSFENIRSAAVESLHSISNELSSLDAGTQQSLAELAVGIEGEIDDINKEISQLLSGGTLSPEDSQREDDLRNRRNELTEELRTAQAEVNDEILSQVRTYENASRAQKILLDAEKERKSLLESQQLDRAIRDGREVVIDDTNSEGIRAFVENEKGEQIELTEFKNIQRALETQNQLSELAERESAIIDSIEKERDLTLQLITEHKNIHQSYTDFLGQQTEKRNEFIDLQIAKAKELGKELRELGLSGINFPTTPTSDSSSNQTIQTFNITQNNSTAGAAEAANEYIFERLGSR